MKTLDSYDGRLPLYERLREDLTARIAAQQWRPGDPIPTESELVKQYDVSVGTVRKTIDIMVAEGLIERFQGRGTFVRRAKFDSSLFRFFRYQNGSGERRIPESRILRCDVAKAPAAVASSLELAVGAKTIRLSRLRLFDSKPILAEEIWLPYDRFSPLVGLNEQEFGDLLYPTYEEKCGQVVASAEETLTADIADSDIARLLQLKRGAPIITIERLARGYDRSPLEWRSSRGPANQFRYQVEIR